MRIMLMSVSAGGGHNAAAAAVKKEAESRGWVCTVVDTLLYINPILERTISKGYVMSAMYTPREYARLYSNMERLEKSERLSKISDFLAQGLSKSILDCIDDFKPDFIVCTHIISSLIVDSLKEWGDIDIPSAGVVTDFTIHPFWPDIELTEHIVIACEELSYEAERRGIAKEKILPIGIPIKEVFSKKIDRHEAARMVGIDPDKKTVLMISGALGFGRMDRYLGRLSNMKEDFQIVVICGNNSRLKKRIEKMVLKKRTYVFGYVDNVDVFMDASDCIVTKPGGLTISEAMCKEIPIIITDPIPGQEERNSEFLQNNGLAIKVSKTYPIDVAIAQIFGNERRANQLRENMRVVGKKHATRDLCDIIERAVQKRN